MAHTKAIQIHMSKIIMDKKSTFCQFGSLLLQNCSHANQDVM